MHAAERRRLSPSVRTMCHMIPLLLRHVPVDSGQPSKKRTEGRAGPTWECTEPWNVSQRFSDGRLMWTDLSRSSNRQERGAFLRCQAVMQSMRKSRD